MTRHHAHLGALVLLACAGLAATNASAQQTLPRAAPAISHTTASTTVAKLEPDAPPTRPEVLSAWSVIESLPDALVLLPDKGEKGALLMVTDTIELPAFTEALDASLAGENATASISLRLGTMKTELGERHLAAIHVDISDDCKDNDRVYVYADAKTADEAASVANRIAVIDLEWQAAGAGASTGGAQAMRMAAIQNICFPVCPNVQPRPGYVTPAPNGCSASPDKPPVGIPPVPVGFTPCCNTHDNCYGTCQLGPGSGKSACDSNFLTCMVGQCQQFNRCSGAYLDCMFLSGLYYRAVQIFGLRPYCRAQQAACHCVR